MGFVPFAYTPRKASAAKGTGIKVSMRLAPKSKTPNMVINISTEVAKKYGFTNDCRFLVAFGDGVDTGTLRLTPTWATGVGFPCKHKQGARGGWVEIALGVVPFLPTGRENPRWVEFKSGQGSQAAELLLQLPRWAFKAAKDEVEPPPVVERPEAAEVKERLVEKGLMKPPPPPDLARLKALVPAPNFSGKQKPTRKQVIAQVGTLKGR